MKEKETAEGFITAVHRERYEVCIGNKTLFAKLKTAVYYSNKYNEEFPTVGDNVVLEYNSMGDSLIIKTEERKTKFSRRDPDKGIGEQILAANFDYVFIMMSLNFDFNLKRLERYITASWESGATPVIILTKADIAEEIERKIVLIKKIAVGVEIYPVSSVTGKGTEELKKYLQPDKMIVFLGSSGVGKSTFTNFLLGQEAMETQGIRESDSKGHHTTTHRQLFVLEGGTRIIDTPGMRELGMWVVDDGIDQSFSDVHDILQKCRFNNCTHLREPGCAVQEALESGILSPDRWKNYLKILKESDYQAARERKNKTGKIKAADKRSVKFQKRYK